MDDEKIEGRQGSNKGKVLYRLWNLRKISSRLF